MQTTSSPSREPLRKFASAARPATLVFRTKQELPNGNLGTSATGIPIAPAVKSARLLCSGYRCGHLTNSRQRLNGICSCVRGYGNLLCAGDQINGVNDA